METRRVVSDGDSPSRFRNDSCGTSPSRSAQLTVMRSLLESEVESVTAEMFGNNSVEAARAGIYQRVMIHLQGIVCRFGCLPFYKRCEAAARAFQLDEPNRLKDESPTGSSPRNLRKVHKPKNVNNPLLIALRETCDKLMQEEDGGGSQPFSTWNVELATIHQSITRLEELAGIAPEMVDIPQHWPKPTSADQEDWKKWGGKGCLLHVRLCYGREEEGNEYEVSYGRMFISTAGLSWMPAAGEEGTSLEQMMRWQEILDLAKGDDNSLGVVEDDQIQISLKSGRVLHLLLAMPRFVPEDLTKLRQIWQSNRFATVEHIHSSVRSEVRTSVDSATPSYASATRPDRLPLATIPEDFEPLEEFVLHSATLRTINKALKAEDGGPLRRILAKEDVMGAFDIILSPWVRARGSGTLVRRLRFRIRLPASAAAVGATTSAVTDIFRFRSDANEVVLVSASCTHDVPFVGNKFRVEVHYVFNNADGGGVHFRMYVNVEWLEDLSFFCPVSRSTVESQTESKMRKVAMSLAHALDEHASDPDSPRVGPLSREYGLRPLSTNY